ncbi:PREDICTED: uncharacterized protein LOC109173349 [Ipomoea nil]|uniref:uncharacterized protein LOC109173349 n=1 Tax=Ipomoea nil TaxID=35883 RepID=UPI0009019B8B|nr:PREDICTED: uncharacterized protein LOC109173349 [Ipomoea nil]
MFIMVWNCQGAASKSFRRALKQFIRVYNPSIVCLLEPKVSGDHANRICNSLGFRDWIRVEAYGFSGGIWVFWKDVIKVEIITTHPQFISMQVIDNLSEPWLFTVVYGSPNQYLRRNLFADLSGQDMDVLLPWLIAGDFNSVTCQEEVNNQDNFSISRSSDFNDWIFREGLVDLGFAGSKFTWMRGSSSSTFKGARRDRALANTTWKLKFPSALVEHLPIVESDHSPLLINMCPSTSVRRQKPFRFIMAWGTHPNFQDVVRQSWDKDIHLALNLRNVAEALTRWNKNVFGNIFYRKKKILARLSGVQRSLTFQIRSDLLKLEKKLR